VVEDAGDSGQAAEPPDTIRAIVKRYIETKGILIESPELYISHVVKQSGGVPQYLAIKRQFCRVIGKTCRGSKCSSRGWQ